MPELKPSQRVLMWLGAYRDDLPTGAVAELQAIARDLEKLESQTVGIPLVDMSKGGRFPE